LAVFSIVRMRRSSRPERSASSNLSRKTCAGISARTASDSNPAYRLDLNGQSMRKTQLKNVDESDTN
jgi:hypothetical protein